MSLVLIRATQKPLTFWNLFGGVHKNKVLIKIQSLCYIHFISLKFFESTQKCWLFLNLLGSSKTMGIKC